MKRSSSLSVLAFIALFLGACAPALRLVHVSTSVPGQSIDDTYAKVASALVGNGFDIAQENKEAGYMTTSFKKWSYVVTSNEPKVGDKTVTLRLQIRATVSKLPDDKIQVQITPGAKQHEEVEKKKSLSESIVSAAVDITKAIVTKGAGEEDLGTDSPVAFFSKKDREIKFYSSEEKKIRVEMLNLVLKAGDDISAALGLGKDQLKINTGKY